MLRQRERCVGVDGGGSINDGRTGQTKDANMITDHAKALISSLECILGSANLSGYCASLFFSSIRRLGAGWQYANVRYRQSA